MDELLAKKQLELEQMDNELQNKKKDLNSLKDLN